MQLSLPLKTIRTYFKKVQTDSLSADYKKWRQRFLLERLHLATWIAVVAYPTFLFLTLFTFSALNATGDPSKAVSQDRIVFELIEFTVVELCLLLCLTLLRTLWARRYPKLLFLGFSWSVTLIPQILATLQGEAQLVTLSWFLMFPVQATLMPVCCFLHIVSQVGALSYYFVVNLVFGLNDPNIREIPVALINIRIALIFFWLCFICDLGVYLYERLQLREFESRQQLRVFLHAVSHDLRNPVLGTLMVLRNLLQLPGEKVQVSRTVLERIADSSDRQLELINSLIDTHDAEVRGVVLHCQPLQLSPLVQSAIADLQPMLTKEQAHLTNLIPADLPAVNADPIGSIPILQK
jgi:signal transduction histidine kinase